MFTIWQGLVHSNSTQANLWYRYLHDEAPPPRRMRRHRRTQFRFTRNFLKVNQNRVEVAWGERLFVLFSVLQNRPNEQKIPIYDPKTVDIATIVWKGVLKGKMCHFCNFFSFKIIDIAPIVWKGLFKGFLGRGVQKGRSQGDFRRVDRNQGWNPVRFFLVRRLFSRIKIRFHVL